MPRTRRHEGAGRRRWIAAAAVVGAVVVAVAVLTLTGGEDGPSPQVRALQSDPMGRYVPPHARLAKTVRTNDRGGGTLGKQQTARYTRLFSVPAAEAQTALNAAVAAARDAGWEISEAIAGTAVTGSKQLATGPATLAISLARSAAALPEGVAAPAISIALAHVRV